MLTLNRHLSADTIVPDPGNPQSFNRFSYVLNRPLNFFDPTGHCDENYGDRYEDYDCWRINENLVDKIEQNPDYATAIGWDDEMRESYEKKDEDNQLALLKHHGKQMNSPQACWGAWGSGACNRAKFVDAFHLDEILPDALILGESANSGGVAAATVGGEIVFHESGDIRAFGYSGYGSGVGQSLDASVPVYGGVVWNLENLENYEGDFWALTADYSMGAGGEIALFGAPGAIPFVNNGTWGVAGKPVTGFGTAISYYETNYVPASDIQQNFWGAIQEWFK